MISRRNFLKLGAAAATVILVPKKWSGVETAFAASPKMAKYVDALPIPSVIKPDATGVFRVSMSQVTQKLHRDLPATPVWTYNGTFPGPSFDVRQGQQVQVEWKNNLPATHLLSAAIDPTIPMHGMYPDVRTVPHLHGGFTLPQFDGHPEAWFTQNQAQTGHHFISSSYTFKNEQPATTLWYHDHAMGITRLNVYAGLAGFYLIRDSVEDGLKIPKGAFEVPIVLQDRTFNPDGSLFYPTVGVTPMHPIWVPEFFGDTPVVNGKAYPFLSVEPRRYRLRLLNGSQARFYNLWFEDGKNAIPFYQIGTDGGFLGKAVKLSRLVLAPGERADLIFDFTNLKGKTITVKNNAKTPFPNGMGGTLPSIMQIKVNKALSSKDTSVPADQLVLPAIAAIKTKNAVVRDIVLKENMDMMAGAPMEVLINGKYFHEPVTESPFKGATEVWQFINLTEDAHPMHIHLVQFQVLNRQPFDAVGYDMAWSNGLNPVLNNYLTAPAIAPDPNEKGWKDTARILPGQVLRVAAKFDMPSGTVQLPMGMTYPQYVYHCHILEHEDNEMMRPFEVR